MSETLVNLSNDLASAVERAAPAVVAVNARQRLASSGVHWQPGVIVTAEHTVKIEEEITVRLPSNETVPATLVGRDASTDLAVLRLHPGALRTAELGDASTLRIGHVVVALGQGPAASWGVVSAVGGPWRTWRGGRVDRLLRLDLTLYPGFSGGPLVTAEGRVVGINSSGLSRHMPVAIPADTVTRVVGELLSKGRIARGYLGVGLQPVQLPESLRRKIHADGDVGLVVVNVQPDGPAAAAGLLIGDILVAIDRTPVGDVDELQAVLGPETVGRTVAAAILRGGEPAEVSVRVAERADRRP